MMVASGQRQQMTTSPSTKAGGDCPTVVQGSGVVDALGFEFRVRAEWDLPCDVSGVDVDCLQLAPGWLLARPEFVVVPEACVESPGTRSRILYLWVRLGVFNYSFLHPQYCWY